MVIIHRERIEDEDRNLLEIEESGGWRLDKNFVEFVTIQF